MFHRPRSDARETEKERAAKERKTTPDIGAVYSIDSHDKYQ